MPVSDVRVWDGSQWVSIKGPKGDVGAPGAAATIAIGTVSTGAPGTSVQITDTNPSTSAATFNFTIPRGDPGQAATVQVGTVSTGAAGSNAQITNAGTANAAVLNFTIPKGDKGDPGSGVTIKGTLSGAATALPATPATGDMWILGDPVPTAAPGATKAPGDGIVWNGTAWTNVGPIRGPQGTQGNPGAAASIAVGTVTGLAAGSTPTVQNTGTAQAAIFAFGIPQGEKGDPGTPGKNAEIYTNVEATPPTGAGTGAIWLVN